jgi:uncharacterized membrane protein YphA (DoxX/SURF4 family)
MSNNLATIGIWALKLIAAVIMLQTLFFKFTAAPESVYIFTTIGMEPVGRVGIGVLELLATILLLYPKTTALGALLALGLMAGAIYFHLTKLGIVVQQDGGQLFFYAVLVLLSSLALIIIYMRDLLHFFHLTSNQNV